MAFDVMIPLREAIETLSHDNDVRVVVLTGAGQGFCSGADLEDAGYLPNIDGLTVTSIARRALELLDDVIHAIRKMHQPVIGAINGAAIGGGFCLACACDIRVASEAAYFRAAGINNGLTASELGISYLLPREIGSARAFDIMLTGRDVDAAEAERIGLVSRVVSRRAVARRVLHDGGAHDRLLACRGRGHEAHAVVEPRRRAVSRPTWTTRASPSSTCASRPRTSRRPSEPARRSAPPSTATDGHLDQYVPASIFSSRPRNITTSSGSPGASIVP